MADKCHMYANYRVRLIMLYKSHLDLVILFRGYRLTHVHRFQSVGFSCEISATSYAVGA